MKYVSQPLKRFQILVGANASGKTTFLDTVAFCADLLNRGLEDTIKSRADDFRDLIWLNEGLDFEIAIELEIPPILKENLKGDYNICRYELRIGEKYKGGSGSILAERLWLKQNGEKKQEQQYRLEFPSIVNSPNSIITSGRTPRDWRVVVKKEEGRAQDYFKAETTDWNNPFKLGPYKSAFANLPEDETKFPVATWLKGYLKGYVQTLKLNSEAMRKSTPPGQPTEFRPDGSNLPSVVKALMKRDHRRLNDWIKHIRTALPEITNIKVVQRPDDRFLYFKVRYENGLEAPSWLISDGTLRMLALTLIAYIPGLHGLFLIEEPENGIHPKAVETVFQSLSSVYEAQILIATHSPVILGVANLDDILCFAKTQDGATDIVWGPVHPRLKDWQGDVNLGTLFASGVLG